MGDSQWRLQKQEIPLHTQTHVGDQISKMKTKDISKSVIQHIKISNVITIPVLYILTVV